MFHPDTQFLIDRWLELARRPAVRGGVPPRSNFAPEVLGAGLQRAFLLQGSSPDARFRLCGSWLEGLQDRALGGTRFMDVWCDSSTVLVASALAQSAREARPVVIVAQRGAQAAPVEVALAPLRDADGRSTLLLGLVAPGGAIDAAADRVEWLTARLTVAAGDRGRPALSLVQDRRSA